MSTRSYGDFEIYRRLCRQARPYWPHLAALFLLGLLATPAALLLPLPLAMVVDNVTASEGGRIAVAMPAVGVVLAAAVLMIGVALFARLETLATSWLGTYTGEQLIRDFRARLFRHVQRLSLSYHDSKGTADSIYRIYWDAASIQWVSIAGLIPLCGAALTLIAMASIMAQVNWQFALV